MLRQGMSNLRLALRHRRWLFAAVAAILVGGVAVAIARPGDTTAEAAASAGTTQRVSVGNGGAQTRDNSGHPAITPNGRYVAFDSRSPIDALDKWYEHGHYGSGADVYVRDTWTGHTTLISRGHEFDDETRRPVPGGDEDSANGDSYGPSISADGRFVAFYSAATNIVDVGGFHYLSVLVCDRDPDGNGVLDESFAYTMAGIAHSEGAGFSVEDGENGAPSLSADGSRLGFIRDVTVEEGESLYSTAVSTMVTFERGPRGTLLTPTDSNNWWMSVPDSVTDGSGESATTYQYPVAHDVVLSGDGDTAAFLVDYVHYVGGYYLATYYKVAYLYDFRTEHLGRLDLDDSGRLLGGAGANFGKPTISADGSRLAMAVKPIGAVTPTIRMFDLGTGDDERSTVARRSSVVARNTAGAAVAAVDPALSADGRYLAYVTDADRVHNGVDDQVKSTSCIRDSHGEANLAPVSNCDVVVRDLVRDAERSRTRLAALPAELASASAATTCKAYDSGSTCEGDGNSFRPVLSGDGAMVAFASAADDLAAGDTNGFEDVYLRRFAPTLTAQPVDFGTVPLGGQSTLAATLTYAGFGPLGVASVTVEGAARGDYGLPQPDTCLSTVLHEGDSCMVTVRYAPKADGVRAAELVVAVRGAERPLRIPLTGSTATVDRPGFGTGATPLDFGTRAVLSTSAPQSVTVTNSGRAPMTIRGVTITTADPENVDAGAGVFSGDYRITGNTCVAAPVPAGGTCQVAVVHRPLGVGQRPAVLRFDDDAATEPHLVPVTGAGEQPTLTVSPTLVRAGQVAAVRGAAFPAGQTVVLSLDGMPGQQSVVADATGAFSVQLLVLPRTSAGERALRAAVTVASPAVSLEASTQLAVMPGSLQPPDFAGRN